MGYACVERMSPCLPSWVCGCCGRSVGTVVKTRERWTGTEPIVTGVRLDFGLASCHGHPDAMLGLLVLVYGRTAGVHARDGSGACSCFRLACTAGQVGEGLLALRAAEL